jgi:hypothetical protein
MTSKELLVSEIDTMPDTYIGEVLDFLRFLKAKAVQERGEITIASEAVLAKDWLRPEEEEAWRNL